MLTRRSLIAALAATTLAPRAFAGGISIDEMRGAIDAVAYRDPSPASDMPSRKLQAMIDAAAKARMPLRLPAGTYSVSNLTLPDNTQLTGVAGATRLVYSGDGHMITATNARSIRLSGLTIDGANKWLGDDVSGLLQFAGIANVEIENCEISGSAKHGISLERCGGRIAQSHVSGASDAGIYAVQSVALGISGNKVEDCGNGGILVHRWQKGEDGSTINGNRIARIGARDGGTGQNGNGINVFRADNVSVAGNHITDCAFTAVRANSASDVLITDNQCLRSGETAIYVEFEFVGATVTGNLVDGAANGILITNFDKGGRLANVTGNVVRNLSLTAPYAQDGGFGIGIGAEADTTISSNTIENAPLWGIKLGWGQYMRNLVATGNIVRNAGVGCAVSVAEGAGSAVISDNLFEETKKGAVIGFLWDKPASGELATRGSSVYPQLTVERNRVV